MFELLDGRSALYQWDTDRYIKVLSDESITQVHFSKRTTGVSINVEVVQGCARIPDELLQNAKDLYVYAYVEEPGTSSGYTKHSAVFTINRRSKPADYFYTPTDQISLGEILERIEKLEDRPGADISEDAIQNAVNKYLENNSISFKETDPTVSEWAKAKNKPEYTAKEVGALSQTELQNGVNSALAQAKESGEFNGKNGKDGADYALTEADKKEIAGIAIQLFPIYQGEVESV